MFSRKKRLSEASSISVPSSEPTSSQRLQFPINSPSQLQLQSPLQSPQEKQPSQSVCAWSAHAPPFGHAPSPFLRESHALSTSATAAGELFLFGGYVHRSRSPSNDLYVISTQDFSTTLLKTNGDVPSPRYGHRAVLTSTTLSIWGGKTDSDFNGRNAQNQSDDSFYLLNLGTSDLIISRPAPADQSSLRPSIARVDPHRGQGSGARWSLQPYHDVGRLQALRLWWPDRQKTFK